MNGLSTAPETSESLAAAPSTLADAPLVLLVTLQPSALSESEGIGTTALADAGAANGGGEEDGEPPRAVALLENARDPLPAVDQALRQLDLYRPSPGPGPTRPLTRGPEQGADQSGDAVLAALWDDPFELPASGENWLTSLGFDDSGSPDISVADEANSPEWGQANHAMSCDPMLWTPDAIGRVGNEVATIVSTPRSGEETRGEQTNDGDLPCIHLGAADSSPAKGTMLGVVLVSLTQMGLEGWHWRSNPDGQGQAIALRLPGRKRR